MSAPGHSSAFASLARKRDLWWQFTVRAVAMRHRGSYLGPLWAILSPLLMLAVYGVVLGYIFQNRYNVLPHENGADYVLALYLGLILFNVVGDSLVVSPLVIVGNPNMVKKVVFPLEVLPLSQLGATWFNFLMSFILLLLGAAIFGRGLSVEGLLLTPVILAPLVLLTAGLSWMFSALGVFFRDLTQALPVASQIVLWASAVFYARARITPPFWRVLKWNPFLHTVMLSRNALLWNQPVSWMGLAYTYLAGIAACLFGRWLFHKLQPAFADVI
ncbi:MAG TPA: ABC transporter permease [Opitutaceae bacterium]|nr:ABC transporter permease [Opitutaceae bacterium]